MIFAGDCVSSGKAMDELARLAELIGAPVYAEAMASTAAFPASHPQCAGVIPRLSHQVRAVLERHDLVISIGGDLFTLSLSGGGEPIPAGLPIVHLDDNPWELGKNYPAAAALFGHPKVTLPELCDAIEQRMYDQGGGQTAQHALIDDYRAQTLAEVRLARQALLATARAQSELAPIRPLALLHTIGEILPENAVVIEELLSSAPGVRQMLKSNDEQSFFGMRGGGIGWGLPASLGVKLALPHRPVVALLGDGTSLYTAQALWTAAHDRIAVTFVIFNNRGYRILKQRTLALKGESARTGKLVGMSLLDPPIDFQQLAASMGVASSRVTTLDDVRAALRAALDSGVPNLIEVVVDESV